MVSTYRVKVRAVIVSFLTSLSFTTRERHRWSRIHTPTTFRQSRTEGPIVCSLSIVQFLKELNKFRAARSFTITTSPVIAAYHHWVASRSEVAALTIQSVSHQWRELRLCCSSERSRSMFPVWSVQGSSVRVLLCFVYVCTYC